MKEMFDLPNMNNDFSIREISKTEFQLIANLIIESELIENGLRDYDEAIEFLRNKFNRNKNKVFAVRNSKNEFVSYTVLTIKENPISVLKYNWHIAYLYVKKEFRRLGIAEKLLNFVLGFSIKTRAENISLYTSKENYSAHALYRKMGFIEHNFIANYISFEYDLRNK
ncbi:GNAT family N-acetyltransferase [Flavobacterium sp.]|uniref:GNAT family N-acetyltransferase n=1 Tax=Flavobacterium sp. TaxID=239 RepID=UPI003D12FFE3